MKVYPFSAPRAFRSHLPLAEFAKESGLSKATVLGRARRAQISRTWIESGARPHFRYWVGDLPEGCGSPYLVNFLLKQIQNAEQEAQRAKDALDRVIRHRRAGRAA